ncbi:MAG: RNA polymerase sigma-70 factor [Dysgonamonadaceae bacterium]|jgi:RNA polymerase sigma-70 factor (ECF subfamily)|nr:RNA polymerase sigma-70 factor [Dysgonamonadaceae bacterium]
MHCIKNRNSEEEYEHFFMENYPRVKTFAQQILASEHDAEDVAQDVFLKLIDKPEIWQNVDIKDGYLYKMTKNLIFNLIKHREIERRYREAVKFNDLVFEEFDLEEKLNVKELKLIIIHAIEQMPDMRKKIFKMSRYERKSNKEISEMLNISVRTVEHHIYLALTNLKKTLNFHTPIK